MSMNGRFSERLTGEAYLNRDFEALRVSRRLVRSVSQKLKKTNNRFEGDAEDDARGISAKCLPLYGRGGGCKVGADAGQEYGDPSSRRRSSSASEGGKGYKPICGTDEPGVDCFSYGLAHLLPDDILEMCLVRLPLTSLMNARLVCKKWRYLTTAPRFLQMRRDGLHQNPWLFLFGAVKMAIVLRRYMHWMYQDQWHRIDSDILKGRFMFSVASIQDDVYIVGGCSSLTHFGRVDRSSFRTHKGVLVFSPLTKSWRKVASMRYARSMPILGISEVSSNFSILQSHQHRQERHFPRSRIGGVSDVYEDPHRLSLRRQYRNAFDEDETSLLHSRKSHKFIRQKNDQRNAKGCKSFVLIAIGGLGSWDEPLDSGEIYDPLSNKWTEIQKLPIDFGGGFWIAIQTFPFPPRVYEYYPKLVSCNGRLFMLSVSWCEGDGQIGQRNKAVRKLWELDLMYLTWTEVSVHPDAPMDWNAAFVADKNLIFGVEMFKIFGQVLDFLTVCDVSETGTKWSHISRNHMTHELDASSCITKSLAVLHM
ncbi:hypothetical protein GH714_007385 [Hevea brasiliensis]|uniref:F-box domain-containing protein n=1 Tax=Hevea brasiliensis TaxID=3981 RepID=A0A6A6MCU7_HEVBR|nr:hypothetical protein GH714_007385 [Hevea brasiliensis]